MAETKKSFPKAIGVSGNRGLYGTADTGEYLAKLDGFVSREVYDKMRRNDGQVKSIHMGITLPIRQADYYIEPASEDKQDIEIADTVDKMRHNMKMTWDDTIRHICLQFVYGFMVMEKLYRYDNDLRLVVPEKLDPRMPTSIDEWDYDENKGKLLGPVQKDELGKETTLPMNRILIFTTDREGDNWEGISLFRAMYGPWYIKQRLLKIDAIKHDRHGTGIPVMKVPEGIQEGSDEWNNAESTVQAIHACEKGGLVLPSGYEFDIVTVQNNGGTDVIPSLEYQDKQMARSALQMFNTMGQDKVGSYSATKSFVEMFLDSEQAYANYICEVLNRYWIKEIINFNWNVKEYPKLKVRKIKKIDSLTINLLAKAGLITGDIEIENALRRENELPEKEEIEEETTEPTKDKPEIEKKNPDKAKEVIDKEKENNSMYARIKRDKSSLMNVELSEIEKIPNLFQIEQNLDKASDDLDSELFEMRDLQIEDLITQILGGKKIQNLRVILKKDMYQSAIKTYKEMVKEGKKEVIEELNNQGARIKMSMQDIDYEDLAGLTDDEIGILIETSTDVLKTSLMLHYLEERKRGVINLDDLKKSMREHVNDVSNIHWKNISTTAVNGGWGAGRRLSEIEYKDQIEYSYYSGILDGSICPSCLETSQLPNSQKHSVDDPLFTVPNPKCYSTKHGGNFCRCFNINVFKQEEQEPIFSGDGIKIKDLIRSK